MGKAPGESTCRSRGALKKNFLLRAPLPAGRCDAQ